MKFALKIILTVLALSIVAGCGEEKKTTIPTPVAFDKHDRCLICGMVILNYPGAKAQTFIEGEKEPQKFCSVKDGFVFVLQPENARRLVVFYVSDYGSERKGGIPEKLLNAKEATYVVGSDVRGAMGKSILPFASREEARKFASSHGGDVLGFTDINLQVLKSLKGK